TVRLRADSDLRAFDQSWHKMRSTRRAVSDGYASAKHDPFSDVIIAANSIRLIANHHREFPVKQKDRQMNQRTTPSFLLSLMRACSLVCPRHPNRLQFFEERLVALDVILSHRVTMFPR